MNKKQHPLIYITIIFILCAIAHSVEALWIRTDETFFADNFINKLFGIAVLAVAAKLFDYTWKDLGFVARRIVKGSLIGLLLGAVTFSVAYGIEFLVLSLQGMSPAFEIYVGAFSLTGSEIKNTAFIFFAMCIVFNIVNVVMEEGVFRGLFMKLGMEKYSFAKTNLIVAVFFGVWHLVTPIKSYIDGDMELGMMIIMSIGYIILAGIMSIKWGLWLNITGHIWIGMAEHFFNNTIGNILHVVTATGTDEMQIVRIVIAQLLSLGVVLIVRYKHRKGLVSAPDEYFKHNERQ